MQLTKFIKYGLTGGSAAVLDFFIFVIVLTILNKHYGTVSIQQHLFNPIIIANTAGILCGFLWSFILQKYWTFRSSGQPLLQLLLTATLLAFNIAITNLCIPLLSNLLNGKIEIAKIIMQIAVVIWNYAIYNAFIFKKSRNTNG